MPPSVRSFCDLLLLNGPECTPHPNGFGFGAKMRFFDPFVNFRDAR